MASRATALRALAARSGLTAASSTAFRCMRGTGGGGAGESDSIEFKSSLHHPYGPLPPGMEPARARKEAQKGLRKSVTKTIAAFLNAGGGTLLIGVGDSGTMPDFPYLKQGKQDADGWLLSLEEVIINALGPAVWSTIHASLAPHGSRRYQSSTAPSHG